MVVYMQINHWFTRLVDEDLPSDPELYDEEDACNIVRRMANKNKHPPIKARQKLQNCASQASRRESLVVAVHRNKIPMNRGGTMLTSFNYLEVFNKDQSDNTL